VNFLCFWRWCGEGAGKGEFFVDRCIGLGGFFRGGILTDCAECCEKVKHCQKKTSTFIFYEFVYFAILNISTFGKMRRSLRLKAKRKIIECEKKFSDKHTVEGKHYRLPNC
jgi:hypothetical protein